MEKKPNILVLDDDKSVRVLLERHFTKAGFDVTTHEFPDKAAQADRFDLIVTDFIMDPMTGLQFTKVLRAQGKNVPVIMITGSFHRGIINAAKKVGIKDIVSKPFRGEDVVELVKTLLKKRQSDPAVQQ